MIKKIYFLATLVIAGLLLSSAAGMSITSNEKIVKDNEIEQFSGKEMFELKNSRTYNKLEQKEVPDNIFSTLDNDEDILVVDSTGDDYTPSVAASGYKAMAIVDGYYEDEEYQTIGLKWTIDEGETWLPEGFIWSWISEDNEFQYPKISSGGIGTTAGAVALSTDQHSNSFLFFIEIFDYNEDEVVADAITFISESSGDVALYADVAGIGGSFAPNDICTGIFSFADSDGEWGLFYNDGADDYTFIGYTDPQPYDIEDMASDIDMVKGKFYNAYQVTNDPDDGDFLEIQWCKVDGTNEWWQNSWGSKKLKDEFGSNLDFKINDKIGALVYETEFGEIKCAFASNGVSFKPYYVADGTSPSVDIDGEEVKIVFISNNDLYYTISEDGENWSEPELINDEQGTVVDGFHATSIDGGFALWSDERDDSKDIYFESIGGVVKRPVIIVGQIEGGMGSVTATIENIGNGDGSNIKANMKVTGGILGRIDKSIDDLIIPVIIAGGSYDIEIGGIFGLGAINVVVTSELEEQFDEKDVSGRIFIISITIEDEE